MYVNDVDRITGLLSTIGEAVNLGLADVQEAERYLEDSVEALGAIGEFLEENAPECDRSLICDTKKAMHECLENRLFDERALKRIQARLKKARTMFLQQVDLRWRALFLPYKASMWTSLESIWKAAADDPRCDAIVMPIPYFELDDCLRAAFFRYEGNSFPSDVPITHYMCFSETQDFEMIFIHNPYDDVNTITRVPEAFFSRNLMKQTKCLVYSPYFTFGRHYPGKGDFQFTAPGILNATIILVQSVRVKRLFQQFGYPANKMLVVGSPKVDAIVRMTDDCFSAPEEWVRKISGRTTFLLNTHLYYFHKSGMKGIGYHRDIIECLLERDNCAFIWRPHPLLKTLIRKASRQLSSAYRALEELVSSSANGVIDTTADYRIAFSCSDAMISTYSSLINEYMVTGKPVMIFQRKPDKKAAQNFPLDYLGNYYRFGDESVTFEQFIDMVVAGQDPLRARRREAVETAFKNLDGTAGYEAYRAIVNQILPV